MPYPPHGSYYIIGPANVKRRSGETEDRNGWGVGWSWERGIYKHFEPGNKSEAVSRAKELAKNQEVSGVAIYKSNGELQKVWSNPNLAREPDDPPSVLRFVKHPYRFSGGDKYTNMTRR